MPSPIFTIADAYVDAYADSDPCGALELGVRPTIERLTDYAPGAIQARREIDRKTAADVRAAAETSGADRVARDYMLARLRPSAFEAERPLLDGVWGPMHSLCQTFDQLPRETIEDWARIGRLLRQVPDALLGLRASLDERRQMGASGSRRHVRMAMAYATHIADPTVSPLMRLAQGAPAEVVAPVEDAMAAFAEMAAYLDDVCLPAAIDRDGCGRERYADAVRSFTGGEVDIDDAYEWGWSELHRIAERRRRVCDGVEAGASLARALEVLREDGSGWLTSADEYRSWLQDLLDRTTTELNGKHFDIDPKVQAIEVMASTGGPAYYSPPTEDFSRPGRVWWPLIGRTNFRPLQGLTTAYHEGVPGHHLQNGAVRVEAASLSRFQRVFYLNFHGEGWALYAEALMDELGYLERPEAQLSMLSGQYFRAARVVVDIGLHLGLTLPSNAPIHAGEKWTPGIASELMATGGLPQQAAASEVDRYLAHPGQAITYALGQRAWLRARDAAKSALGPRFDLKKFHSVALALGPLTCEQLEPEIVSACT